MLSSLSQLDYISSDYLVFLDSCIYYSEDDSWSFEKNELYAEEREFLKQFTAEEIENFKRFSDFLRDRYTKENLTEKHQK